MAWSLVKVEQNKSNIVALCMCVCVYVLVCYVSKGRLRVWKAQTITILPFPAVPEIQSSDESMVL